MRNLMALVITTLLLTACGSAGGGAPGVVTATEDHCFGLAGRYSNGTDDLNLSSNVFQYCQAYSNYCGATFLITAKNANGSYQTTSWGATGLNPECPITATATCRFDMIAGRMIMDCGRGGMDYGGKL